MVFDSPLSRSRRSKNCDDKKQPEENKGGNIAKREAKQENTKEETAETEVNSKSILNNKCDLLDTEKAIEINDTVQNIKFTEGRSHTQNDMEDVVEDSQQLSNKSKLSRIALNKIEDTKTILQNKKNSLE